MKKSDKSAIEYRHTTKAIKELLENAEKDLTKEDSRLLTEWLMDLLFDRVCKKYKDCDTHKDLLSVARYFGVQLTGRLDSRHNFITLRDQVFRPYRYRIGIIKQK